MCDTLRAQYAQLQAFSIFEECASAQAECALTLKSVVPKRNRGFHPFRRPRLADYQSADNCCFAGFLADPGAAGLPDSGETTAPLRANTPLTTIRRP